MPQSLRSSLFALRFLYGFLICSGFSTGLFTCKAATSGSGTVTITGSEQSKVPSPCPTGCPVIWDSGTVSVTVNGFTKTVSYQNALGTNIPTGATIASALAAAFNQDPNSPVAASVSNSHLSLAAGRPPASAVVTLTAKASGSATNYSLSATSATSDPKDFSSPSFIPVTSGPTLTGGAGPAPPSNLVATVASNTQISLSWAASPTPGVTYLVIRNGVQVGSGITGTSYSDTGLNANTPYSYQVEASNSQGASAPTNIAQVEIIPPGPATGLTASPLTYSTIQLSWLPSPTPNVSYTAYDASTGFPTNVQFVPRTSGTVTGLAGGTDYCFYVTAFLFNPNPLTSPPSNTACATTPAGVSCTASDGAKIVAGPDISLNIEYELIAKITSSNGNTQSVDVGPFIAFGLNAPDYIDCDGVLQLGEKDEGNEWFGTDVPQVAGAIGFRWVLDDWVLCPDPTECQCSPEAPNPQGQEEIGVNFPYEIDVVPVPCP